MKTLTVKIKVWAKRHGVGFTVNRFGVGIDRHLNDIGLAVSLWYPWLQLSVQLGPVSLWVGFDLLGSEKFVGPGFAWLRFRTGSRLAAWVSHRHWWETSII